MRKVLFISTAKQQQNADDEAGPVGIEAGVVDALVDDGEGQRAQHNAEHRTVSASQKHAPDDHRDDGVENVRLPGGNLCAVVENGLGQADESRAHAAAHEKQDGHTLGRDPGVARADLVAAHRKDPVAVVRIVQDEAEDDRSGDPPEDGHLKRAADELPQQKLGLWAGLDRDARGSGQDDAETKGQPRHGEQRPQGDDERRDSRPDHKQPVDESDNGAESERGTDPDQDRSMKMSRYDRDGHGSRGDHRADGDVEFPGDHQQTNRNRHDAERSRNIEPTRGARRGRKLEPPKIVKKTKTAARPRNEPVSGRRTRLPSERLWVWAPRLWVWIWVLMRILSRWDFDISRRAPPPLKRRRARSCPAIGHVLGPDTRAMFAYR